VFTAFLRKFVDLLESAEYEREHYLLRRKTMSRKYVHTVAIAILLVGGTAVYRLAIAQGGIQIIPQAQGYSPERRVKLDGKGPFDVLTLKLITPPLGDLGWHTHPGPAIVTVTQGSLTEYHANGCISMYTAGDAFFEQPGEVHRVVNPDPANPAEGFVTFILPAGQPPIQPAVAPQPSVCGTPEEHR
jgi:quercetin dioxygenase-like cupin family protein